MATIVPDDFARVLGNTRRIDVLRLVELCLALEADPAVVIDELCRTDVGANNKTEVELTKCTTN